MTYKELIRELNRLISEIEYREHDNLDQKIGEYRMQELTPATLDKVIFWNIPS